MAGQKPLGKLPEVCCLQPPFCPLGKKPPEPWLPAVSFFQAAFLPGIQHIESVIQIAVKEIGKKPGKMVEPPFSLALNIGF